MVSIPQWLNSLNLKGIVAWVVDNVAGELIAGIILLSIGSISIKKWQEKRDKKRIYNWLYDETKENSRLTVGVPNDPRWRSTREIARHNNLTVDRVSYICSIHKGILLVGEEDLWPNESLEEKWAIKEFVRK